MIPEIVIIVRDGRVEDVMANTTKVNVSVLDFDTDDAEKLEEVEEAGKDLQERIESLELVSVL